MKNMQKILGVSMMMLFMHVASGTIASANYDGAYCVGGQGYITEQHSSSDNCVKNGTCSTGDHYSGSPFRCTQGQWYGCTKTQNANCAQAERDGLPKLTHHFVNKCPVCTQPPVPVNGQCNSTYNGKVVSSKPSGSGICTKGTPSAVSGTGTATNKWKWSCGGKDGGTTANCSATKTPVNGVCSSQYNGQVLYTKPSGDLCTSGIKTTVTGTGTATNPWRWKCNGNLTGTDASCSARKKVCPANKIPNITSFQIKKKDAPDSDYANAITVTDREQGLTFKVNATQATSCSLYSNPLDPNGGEFTMDRLASYWTNPHVITCTNSFDAQICNDDASVAITVSCPDGSPVPREGVALCPSICGAGYNASKVVTEVPTTGLCVAGATPEPVPPAYNEATNRWEWTCNSVGSETCTAQCKPGMVPDPVTGICECKSGTIDCGSGVCEPITVEQATATLHADECPDGAKAVVKVGSGACAKDLECKIYNDDGEVVSKDHTSTTIVGGSGEIEIEAEAEDGTCSIEAVDHANGLTVECEYDGDKKVKKTAKVQCVCTATKCSDAGTCQAIPIFATSYDPSKCVSECTVGNNASCSGGGTREVGL